MAEVSALGSVTLVPFTARIVSPAWMPPSWAALRSWPGHWTKPATLTVLDPGTPKATTAIHARTKAMTKCMNEPADATMIRLWKGCWR